MSMKKKNLGAAAQAATQRLFTGAQAEAERQEDTRKPLNDTEKAVLEKYNAGMTVQTEIAEAIGKDPAGVSRALKRIREEYPELLQEPDAGSGSAVKDTEGQQETKTADMPQEGKTFKIKRQESEPEPPKKITLMIDEPEPQKSAEAEKRVLIVNGKTEPEKPQETAQEKPQKARKQVFSFRAEVNAITCWKAYATATGQTMESVGNAAMTEFLKNHPLTENEKVVFDALTASVNK